MSGTFVDGHVEKTKVPQFQKNFEEGSLMRRSCFFNMKLVMGGEEKLMKMCELMLKECLSLSSFNDSSAGVWRSFSVVSVEIGSVRERRQRVLKLVERHWERDGGWWSVNVY